MEGGAPSPRGAHATGSMGRVEAAPPRRRSSESASGFLTLSSRNPGCERLRIAATATSGRPVGGGLVECNHAAAGEAGGGGGAEGGGGEARDGDGVRAEEARHVVAGGEEELLAHVRQQRVHALLREAEGEGEAAQVGALEEASAGGDQLEAEGAVRLQQREHWGGDEEELLAGDRSRDDARAVKALGEAEELRELR
eukprot:CAMPEP_0205884740 /NCGR_PEP_ID=MMETSP1083-20121108/18279_1 /ASSEMBLY_ACC=CAM_ASM_000430 /TAXON_ID=97485 /ORGANISM="Prymnesium parvum, Strain Texoma1" /LENGTH=196 /DNA_ID=CAMNT_0053248161 /DNA_START=202 /DNA_END=788 /DNA_ORIENTATION=-